MELNEKYPQILYSNLIDPILSLPPEPKKNKVKPIMYPIILVALLFSICSISVSFIRFKDSVIEGVLGTFFSIVIFLFVIVGIIFILDTTWGYKIRYNRWNKQIADLKENELKRKQRKEQIELLIRTRQSAEIETYEVDESVRKGISEIWFYKQIKKVIEPRGGEVSINKKVMIFGHLDLESMSTNFFYPDIAIIIENLYIDVEIDEPYTMDSKLPIHCVGSDDYRNYYFASNGWEIIRFSEQQIVEHTEKCIETIKNTIDYILNGTYDNPVADPSGSWITNRWDETSAKNMMKNRFRESYLYDDMGNLKTL